MPTTSKSYALEAANLADLVEAALAGCEEAWEQLYRHSFPRLLAYARRRLPSEEHARDAVAETMSRAVSRLDRFSNEGSGFDGWLYGILRHVVIDMQRRLGRESPAASVEVPGTEPTASDAVVEQHDVELLRAAFARLSPTDQELLELRIVAGLSAEAVAAATGSRAGAIRMAQTRALARLRDLLSEVGWNAA